MKTTSWQGDSHEVVIVGAGPAGLSAALVLGRCCRRVLVCDAGTPRNAASRGVHGFLTRDGILPAELRQIGRAQLAPYDTVEVRDVEVTQAESVCPRGGDHDGFEVTLSDGSRLFTRTLLLATGVVDELPPIPGLRERWGTSVFPCPYCDGWELRGRRLGVLGHGEEALSLCRALTTWTDDIVVFSDGPTDLDPQDEHALEAHGVRLIRDRVRALGGPGCALSFIELEGAAPVTRDALFVSTGQHQRSPLVTALGCTLDPRGRVATGEHESTNVPGLFVAGDASGNVQLAIVAAAEGAEAAFAINRSLVREAFASTSREQPSVAFEESSPVNP